MTIPRRFAMPVAAALVTFAAFSTSHAGSDAAIEVSSNNVLVGGQTITVTGADLSSCSGATVNTSLIFPTADNSGNRQPVTDATKVNTVAASVDESGSFESEVPMPTVFPGAWLGYVIVEGDCIDVGPGFLLLRISVSVALGSEVAQQLGISQQQGAVLVVPAGDIRGYPIMADDPIRDPYEKLAPFVAVGQDGRECGRADSDSRNAAGDILIQLSADCAGDGSVVGMKVLSTGVLLDTRVTVHEGQATGVRMVFPPPGTANERPAPAPPLAGNAEVAVRSEDGADATIWLIAFVIACVASVALVSVRRRVG